MRRIDGLVDFPDKPFRVYKNYSLFDDMIQSKSISLSIVYDFVKELNQHYHTAERFVDLQLLPAEALNSPYLVSLLRNAMLRLFFIPQDDVCEAIQATRQLAHADRSTHICYQIRTGGALANHHEKSTFLNVSDVNAFYLRLASHLQRHSLSYRNVSLFVASDSDVLVREVTSFFNGSIPVFSQEAVRGHSSLNYLRQGHDLTVMKTTLVDLFTLSSCDYLVSTMFSSYGQFAHFLSFRNSVPRFESFSTSCSVFYPIHSAEDLNRQRQENAWVNKGSGAGLPSYRSFQDMIKEKQLV